MRNYQLDLLMVNPDAPIPDNVRLIKDDDIDRYNKINFCRLIIKSYLLS